MNWYDKWIFFLFIRFFIKNIIRNFRSWNENDFFEFIKKINLNNRRKFRSQISNNMKRWKAEQGRGREKRKSKKKEDGDARQGRKIAKHCVFPMICGSGGSKSRLAKTAGAEPAGQMRDKKLHAVVARSTFASQNAQSTPGSDHFWKLRCRKSARRCGAKHVCKSKCTKHTIVGPLLKVVMSKKCTPLRREAHFQVKIYKTHHCRTTFGSWDVEKVHFQVKMYKTHQLRRFGPLLEVKMSKKCTPLWREAHFEVKTLHVRATFGGSDVEKVHAVVARSTFRSENVQNTRGSSHFWRFRCHFAASLHYTTLRYITPHSTILHYITLHYTPQHYNYNYTTRLRSTTLHYIKFHYATLHYTTLHYTTLH